MDKPPFRGHFPALPTAIPIFHIIYGGGGYDENKGPPDKGANLQWHGAG